MYVTRPLSLYKKEPAALSIPPPEGPYSGYLVIQDEEDATCCFGFCTETRIKHLPFPQNKDLTVSYTTSNGDSSTTYRDKVIFIPALNQPLSSNRYYVIRREGKHQGEASTSSTEEDMGTCLCCTFIRDVKPRPLDQSDVFQQVEIIRKRYGFHAKSIVQDGFPPEFLRRKGWTVYKKTPKNYYLNEASGLNSSLRARLPDFSFPLANDCSASVVIGKWYCPFMFVKEGMTLKDQMKTSVFYPMTLEQRWDKIFSQENTYGEEKVVHVDVVVQTEAVLIDGREAVWNKRNVVDDVLWFRGGDISVGLSLPIVERMKWEQQRVGWVGGDERQVRIERVEEFGRTGMWKRFGCYVLVESFVLRRMSGSLVLKYDFKHTHEIRCKWE
ncbi:DUF1262 family protein [Quillaja saponaria]|uniref:DUF1262 family protein n=1 Tax=Quillaja saponaria TaxID=32244 RepID=A0AAD7LAA0_QUISA|nr:DUF1262 family protein [Quillaja saponaria]